MGEEEEMWKREGGEVGGLVVVLCLATGASSLWLQLLIPDAKM